MTSVSELIDYLESHAPLLLQEDYDNAGLLVGDSAKEVSGVLISLDTTEDVLDEALSNQCNTVISHHPVIFKGLKKLSGNHYVQRVVRKAILNNLAIYAIHTNLDSVLQNGVNSKICQRLQLSGTSALLPSQKVNSLPSGSGMQGFLKQELIEKDFLRMLQQNMRTPLIRHSSLTGRKVRKVAVCGGSGAFLLEQAIKEGADVFISADFKYHDFFEADNRILIADIGHYESEQFTIDLLFELITEKFANFAALKTKVITNPIHYFH